ncbi:MAG: flagellar protein FlaG [Betaproteobacteria bacterium]|nr:flagellar protein FlaG [Betaproteobacteria bacterium]
MTTLNDISVFPPGNIAGPSPLPAAPSDVRSATPVASPGGSKPSENLQRQAVDPAKERDRVKDAVKDAQDALGPAKDNLEFSIDDKSGKVIVKLVDTSTNEVIRQIPSKEMLAIAEALDNFSQTKTSEEEAPSGVFLNNKV